MIKYLLAVLILNLYSLQSYCQQNSIQEDPIIAQMMNKFVEINKTKKTVSGWRIQISSTTDRRAMDELIIKFNQNYPDEILSWVHAKPYYQLRAGAFRTKMESLRLLSLLKAEYPDAYPVVDNNIKQSEIAGVRN
ncbi:MAG: SPOR domain-containing protein [Saprospiraceae bacterium]